MRSTHSSERSINLEQGQHAGVGTFSRQTSLWQISSEHLLVIEFLRSNWPDILYKLKINEFSPRVRKWGSSNWVWNICSEPAAPNSSLYHVAFGPDSSPATGVYISMSARSAQRNTNHEFNSVILRTKMLRGKGFCFFVVVCLFFGVFLVLFWSFWGRVSLWGKKFWNKRSITLKEIMGEGLYQDNNWIEFNKVEESWFKMNHHFRFLFFLSFLY